MTVGKSKELNIVWVMSFLIDIDRSFHNSFHLPACLDLNLLVELSYIIIVFVADNFPVV